MTNRERLEKMSDEDLADWLCKQMFADYKAPISNKILDMTRLHTVRNFLKMEYREESNDT